MQRKDIFSFKKLLTEEIAYLLFQHETIIRDYQTIQRIYFFNRAPKNYTHLRKKLKCQTDWAVEL